MRLADHDAFKHQDYAQAVATAARRAHATPGSCHCVYWDGVDIFVRVSTAEPPPNAKRVCIAQLWNQTCVQLRFDHARSEWVFI